MAATENRQPHTGELLRTQKTIFFIRTNNAPDLKAIMIIIQKTESTPEIFH